jgi:hypothetical protein
MITGISYRTISKTLLAATFVVLGLFSITHGQSTTSQENLD